MCEVLYSFTFSLLVRLLIKNEANQRFFLIKGERLKITLRGEIFYEKETITLTKSFEIFNSY